MEELDQIYLIASFPDAATLMRAARALNMAENHLVVLGNEASSAARAAEELGVHTKLDEAVLLDEGLKKRLQWHLEHNDPLLLAVNVMAAQGRDLRHRLQELGGEMIDEGRRMGDEGRTTVDIDY
ncbi:MAG: hypothetical protein ACRDIB_12855 [Ardenticatenaceae bacterium]